MKARYGCRTCQKEVKPKKGRLVCCGFDEPVPAKDPDRCDECGGKRRGYADDYFIKQCWCTEMAIENSGGYFGDHWE